MFSIRDPDNVLEKVVLALALASYVATYLSYLVSPNGPIIALVACFLLSLPIVAVVYRRRYDGLIEAWIPLLLFSFFLAVRLLEVSCLKRSPIRVVEKSWGFLLLTWVVARKRINPSLLGYVMPSFKGVVGTLSLAVLASCFFFPALSWRALVSAASSYGVSVFLSVFLLESFLVANSFFEETLFRGFLYTALTPRLGVIAGGFVVQSLLFGAWHLPHHVFDPALRPCIVHLLFTIAFALTVTVYRMVQGSLLVPIVVHTAFNTVAMTTMQPEYPVFLKHGNIVMGSLEAMSIIIVVCTIMVTLHYVVKSMSIRKMKKASKAKVL